jgi:hypothetical protein
MLYKEISGSFVPWHGEKIDGIKHPSNIEVVWTTQDLIAIGLYRPVVPPVPDNKVIIRESVERVNGIVTYVYTLEDTSI